MRSTFLSLEAHPMFHHSHANFTNAERARLFARRHEDIDASATDQPARVFGVPNANALDRDLAQ